MSDFLVVAVIGVLASMLGAVLLTAILALRGFFDCPHSQTASNGTVYTIKVDTR